MKAGLIIPCYNFSSGIEKTCERVKAWREKQSSDWTVYVVDDGSSDDTPARIKAFAEANPWCRLLTHERNKGKGAAVQTGFKAASPLCEAIIFTDCDLHYGLDIIGERFLPALTENDIVILDRSWTTAPRAGSLLRRLTSFLFNRFVSVLTGVNFRDTQAGLKGFRTKTCASIFERCRLPGFTFDVEVLSIALYYRLRIQQIPILFAAGYAFPKHSTISVLKSSAVMFRDLFSIYFNWKRHAYDDPALKSRIDQAVYTIK